MLYSTAMWPYTNVPQYTEVKEVCVSAQPCVGVRTEERTGQPSYSWTTAKYTCDALSTSSTIVVGRTMLEGGGTPIAGSPATYE